MLGPISGATRPESNVPTLEHCSGGGFKKFVSFTKYSPGAKDTICCC
jgi:hypothetical protein